MMPEAIPEMLKIAVASERTGVSYECIRNLCLEGKIVYIKSGTRYLINFGKFCEYLNTGEGKAIKKEKQHEDI